MIDFANVLFNLAPVVIFLAALLFLDSYKLVKLRSVIFAIIIGCGIAGICFVINKWLIGRVSFDVELYSKYIAPGIEELLKATFIVYLIKAERVGFMIDAAIYGFAIGSGFAIIENLNYLYTIEHANAFVWIIRGFGTAVMHGGTTALVAILTKFLSNRYESKKIITVVPGLLLAICIHSFFNHFFLPPQIMTVAQLLILPLLIFIVFNQSEKFLRDWLELGLETDVVLLEYIMSGHIENTKIGKFFLSLKNSFPGEIVADMLCLMEIHLELAIKAKGIMLMHAAGFHVAVDPEIEEKFNELNYLEKHIGKVGLRALSPVLHTNSRELWQLYLVHK